MRRYMEQTRFCSLLVYASFANARPACAQNAATTRMPTTLWATSISTTSKVTARADTLGPPAPVEFYMYGWNYILSDIKYLGATLARDASSAP